MSLDRTALTLALAAGFALLMATQRPDDGFRGMPPETLWVEKYMWPPSLDVVVSGDSRVAEGVAPGPLAEGLAEVGREGLRVGNFGFGHTGFDEAYLRATRAKLAPDAAAPTVVLGVSPLSLTRHARQGAYSDFHRFHEMLPHQRWAARLTSRWTYPFRPIGTKRLRDAWKGREEKSLRVFHADGWMESAPYPEDPKSTEVRYPGLFAGNPVDPGMVEATLEAVARWSQQGIRVVLVRMPIPDWMRTLEEELAAFDYAAFAERFEAAGGEVLRFAKTYHSYDGAHLRRDAAAEFSRDLGRALGRSAP